MKLKLPVEIVCDLFQDLVKGSRELHDHFDQTPSTEQEELLSSLISGGQILAFWPHEQTLNDHPDPRITVLLKWLPTGADQEENITLFATVRGSKLVDLSYNSWE